MKVVVMGSTGHVGAAVVRSLRASGCDVTALSRRGGHGRLAVDLRDVDALRGAFRGAQRAFLLNPPADVSQDIDEVERSTIAAILAALDGSGLEKVVAASTGGAQAGDRLGDLSTLWTLEQGLGRQPIPAAIHRGAYYYTNWGTQLDAVRKTGRLHSMLPAELKVPMVAPADLGEAAAQRLTSPVDDTATRFIEGPERLTPREVADTFGQVLNRPVELVIVPRDDWVATFRQQGFSAEAADSYARMTAATVDQGFSPPDESLRWSTSFEHYLRDCVANS